MQTSPMRRFLKSASVLAVSQGLVAASAFLRNVVVARHISVADFGIATTFALTMSLLDMVTNLALDRVLVQDDDGGSDAMLASSHLIQATRGVLTGIVLFVLAGPIAGLFELPEVTWAFRTLAVLPVVRGFQHYDMVVDQRKMDFTAQAVVDALPQVAGVLVAYVASVLLADYRAMLVVVISQVALGTIVSHLLAKRPYRWVFRRELAKKKLSFGWPLLVNSLLMFGIFQGDRVLVGSLFSMQTLGWYSVAFSLALLPTLIFARVCGLLLMPGLSRAKNDAEEFLRQCGLSTALCLGCGVFMTTFFAIGGKSVLMLAYGERYAMGNDLLMWLAIGQAVRVIRVAPTIIANSQAKTKNAMYSNMVRTLAIPAALILIRLGFGVKWIAITALCGEVLAMIASYRMLSFGVYKGQFMRQSLAMGAGFLLLSLAAFAVFGSLRATASVLSNLALVLGGGVVGISTAVLVTTIDPGTREQARQVVRRVVRRVREKLATRRS